MPEYGIVNYGSRFEVTGGGRRVAVFDALSDAELFVKIKEGKAERLAIALESILTWLENATEYPKIAELMLLAEYADGVETLTAWKETTE
jgi:hypothetical protein